MQDTIVSVVVPTYNRSVFLPPLVSALIGQTYPAWEALVLDDGSTPDELAAIQAECARDPRIRFMTAGSAVSGAPARRNQGLAAARGRYIIFHDSDDILSPTALAERVQLLDDNPGWDFLVSPTELFRQVPGDTGLMLNTLGAGDNLLRLLRHDNPWLTLSVTYRRGVVERIGGWDETLPSWQDWELHVRALMKGVPHGITTTGLCHYRLAGGEQGSIGLESLSAEHRMAQVALLEVLARRLREDGPQDRLYRRAVGGMFLCLADRARREGRTAEALGIWKRAHDIGLMGRIAWLLGVAYLRQEPTSLVARAWRRLLLRCDQSLFYSVPSRTCMKTPAPASGK